MRIILRDEFKPIETADYNLILNQVLTSLRKLVKDWVYNTALKHKLSDNIAGKAGGEVYMSGSLKLGVYGTSSDIDILCVVPHFVDRDNDFFNDFFNILKAHPNANDLRGIRDAHVPLIKLKFHSIEIDLLFARLRFDSIDDSLKSLWDDSILAGCDEQSINSLNTYRNNDLILSLVPNKEAFKQTLRFIKIWAKRRQLYSNKVGLLGGISWAILTAKICQLFPKQPPNRLMEKFFTVFCKWHWKIPVLLCDIKEPNGAELTTKQWNPRLSEGDQQQLMPIITPAFPCVNSAFNVSHTTKKILLKEFHRGAKIARKINSHAPGATWMQLFKKYDLFKEYSHYLRIDALSRSPEDHLMWEGFVESKVRLLVQELELYSQDIGHIRPEPRGFKVSDSDYKCCTTFLCGFRFRSPKKLPNFNQEYVVDLRAPILKFCEKIMGLARRPGKETNMRITHATLEKLPEEVFENGTKPSYLNRKKLKPDLICQWKKMCE
eukprot:TRINITY_DN12747_c0_g2_i1.p1 TRINITY_DN12747_c0_g2~~TRINITY_DN12747_c0_g2_i1.p1  ORF type:complete len:492 (+),score=124.23 TRINITY_DN12747_c0_g2_i1:212-1687(+)